MRKLVILFAGILLAFTQVQAQQAKKELVEGPQITFAESSYDFGDIEQGDVVKHVYKFENTGTEPLILSNVLVTCGCTASKWPREPIAPGAESELEVTFNSTGKMNKQNKVVTVVSNAVNSQERVKFTTNVLPKTGTQK